MAQEPLSEHRAACRTASVFVVFSAFVLGMVGLTRLDAGFVLSIADRRSDFAKWRLQSIGEAMWRHRDETGRWPNSFAQMGLTADEASLGDAAVGIRMDGEHSPILVRRDEDTPHAASRYNVARQRWLDEG